LEIEDTVGGIALDKEILFGPDLDDSSSQTGLCQKGSQIEPIFFSFYHLSGPFPSALLRWSSAISAESTNANDRLFCLAHIHITAFLFHEEYKFGWIQKAL
jgi:hypothetical protein